MPICRECNNYERFLAVYEEYYVEHFDRDGDCGGRDWVDSNHREMHCGECESTSLEWRMSVAEWEHAHGLAKMEDY